VEGLVLFLAGGWAARLFIPLCYKKTFSDVPILSKNKKRAGHEHDG
jgi:hypothetical protein